MRPASPGPFITAPTDAERCYEMVVRLPKLEAAKRYYLTPWVRIVANCQTDDVRIAAGFRVNHEDGA